MDAAYGGICNLSQASEIILVAGGIGITPILSLLRQLCHIYASRSSTESSALHNSTKFPPITLIWSVRKGFLVSLFCDQLTEVLHKQFPLSPISIKVYYTAPKGDLPPEVSLKLNSVITLGCRPDICDIFTAVKKRSSLSRNVDLSTVHAIACGPEALISCVQSSWCALIIKTLLCICGLINPLLPTLAASRTASHFSAKTFISDSEISRSFF